MEAGLSEVKTELQARDALLRTVEAERARLHRELLTAGEPRSAQGDSSGTTDVSDEADVPFRQHPPRRSRAADAEAGSGGVGTGSGPAPRAARVTPAFACLSSRLEPCRSPSARDPEGKGRALAPASPDQPNHDRDLPKARGPPFRQGEHPGSEQERLRGEVAELTEELRQKELTIAAVARKAALLERQLRAELDAKERMAARQQVCPAAWAARAPSPSPGGHRKVTGSANKPASDPAPAAPSHQQRGADAASGGPAQHTPVRTLEHENEQLRSDLARLRAGGQAAWAGPGACAEAGRCACQSRERLEPGEDRRGHRCAARVTRASRAERCLSATASGRGVRRELCAATAPQRPAAASPAPRRRLRRGPV
ncbi:Deuterosome assembly protein 1 [Galemys pyrenaicus]|uniref:Deuterosome assembly protein 1 n=1 Tax=Galemys pyrenaicus TaxID=202257 RepID=A0A8J6ANU8_GALPY|nr:Deuterosome assembly protein 1 [Galemys pyrenaicus]